MKRILSTILLVTLTGCNPDPVPYPTLHNNDIDLKQTTKVIEFFFTPGKASLSQDELDDLNRQLNTAGAGRASIHATFPSKGSGLHRRRTMHIIRALKEKGMSDKQIHFSGQLPRPSGNSLSVVFDTYRAIPPVCPAWTTPLGSGEASAYDSQYGCSDKHNFVHSLEDPYVLFKSTQPGNYDSARSALGVQNYRIGKEQKLKIESTTTLGGSSSSSGG